MPLPPDVVSLVREFANNSFRYLFRQVDNVADLLRWREPKIARGIDFTQLAVQPETFIAPSFAQLESDVVLRAPFRARRGRLGNVAHPAETSERGCLSRCAASGSHAGR